MLGTSDRWRFSLSSLFWATTVIALGCGFAVIVPVEISHLLIGLIWMIAFGVLTVGLIFGRGDRRAFCVGAFVVVASVWFDIGGRVMQGVHYLFGVISLGYGVPLQMMLWLDLGVLAALAVANGWLCVRARQFFEHD
jgi:hypothetical protein